MDSLLKSANVAICLLNGERNGPGIGIALNTAQRDAVEVLKKIKDPYLLNLLRHDEKDCTECACETFSHG